MSTHKDDHRRPTEGGSYIRRKDGTHERVSFTRQAGESSGEAKGKSLEADGSKTADEPRPIPASEPSAENTTPRRGRGRSNKET